MTLSVWWLRQSFIHDIPHSQTHTVEQSTGWGHLGRTQPTQWQSLMALHWAFILPAELSVMHFGLMRAWIGLWTGCACRVVVMVTEVVDAGISSVTKQEELSRWILKLLYALQCRSWHNGIIQGNCKIYETILCWTWHQATTTVIQEGVCMQVKCAFTCSIRAWLHTS